VVLAVIVGQAVPVGQAATEVREARLERQIVWDLPLLQDYQDLWAEMAALEDLVTQVIMDPMERMARRILLIIAILGEAFVINSLLWEAVKSVTTGSIGPLANASMWVVVLFWLTYLVMDST
jgi:hypothetical protein